MLVGLLLLGLVTSCGAGTDAPTRTVFVTETATGPISTDVTGTAGGASGTESDGVTVGPLGTAAADTTGETGSTDESATPDTTTSSAPIVKIDPLKVDCAKLSNNTVLGGAVGRLPAGTARLIEPANTDRKITGRLKCQYGVSDDRSTIAVQLVLAQFQSSAAAEAQMATTVSSETGLGAKASSTSIQGRPTDILLRDGGLLVLAYDTWTLSVVVDKAVLTEDKLPAALTTLADHALSVLIGT